VEERIAHVWKWRLAEIEEPLPVIERPLAEIEIEMVAQLNPGFRLKRDRWA
jgi:hypothetical protein